VKRSPRMLVLTVFLVLVATPGWALFGGADYLLSIINSVLQEIATVRLVLEDGLHGDILGLYKEVFPGSSSFVSGVFQDMAAAARAMQTVRSDAQRLACDWRFTARTLSLRNGLLAPLHVCKPTFQVTWGKGDAWMQDLEEFHDAVGSFGMNVLSQRADAEDGSWAVIWPAIEDGAEHVRRTPGEANRDEAVALAGADLMAQQNGNLKAMRLLVEQNDRDLERFVERKEIDFSTYLLKGLATPSVAAGTQEK
jgi:hypothetical protein